MGVLGKINGIPVYTSKVEAQHWAKHLGIKGIHTHVLFNVVGYMGGESHAAINAVYKVREEVVQTPRPAQALQPAQPIQPVAQPVQPVQPIQQPVQQPIQQPTYTPPTSTPSGGGGGGY